MNRSVERDVKAMSLGLDVVNQEINFWEAKRKKVRSVKQRLERLYEAKKHLIESPKESDDLLNELKKIQNEVRKIENEST